MSNLNTEGSSGCASSLFCCFRPSNGHRRGDSVQPTRPDPPPAAGHRFRNNGSGRVTDPNSTHPPAGDTSTGDVDPPEGLGNLKSVGLNLLRSSNRLNHKTDRYNNKGLIVRRGWGFKVKVTLSDTYYKDTDLIILKFLKSVTPEFSKKTCVLLTSDQSEKSYMNQGWTLQVVDTQDKELTLEVTPDVDALVGTFTIVVETQRKKSENNIQVSRKTPAKIIVLFNAFHKDDDVYIEDDKDRDEYVMNDTGLIYTASSQQKRHWNFGQFEESILDAALWMLDNGYLKKHLHGNIVHVARALSAEVNGQVLLGNWSGDYTGGISPSKWNGSVKILQQFYNTKSYVRFGQCWVFSGILTSVTRALGIGCRSVSNISSAHDTDGSNTIDHYVDANGDPIAHRNGDSVWNFHVWNEAWMKRDDLPAKYNGWQAFDATPQEKSDGKYRCGPCPIKAVYNGQVDVMYDAPFIFSEVNADRVYWKVVDGVASVYRIETDDVGRMLSTKAVGTNRRQDLTNLYKPAEGSAEERTNAMNAMRRGKKWQQMVKDFENYKKYELDVTYDMKAGIDRQGDCHTLVKITNTSSIQRTVTGKINMFASYNGGQAQENLHESYEVNLTLDASQSETVKWDVPAVDYFSDLDDDAMVQICAVFSVKGTNQTWSCIENIPLDKPDIEITVNKHEVEIGEQFTVKVSFTNPLGVAIHDVDMDMEGPGIYKEMDLVVRKVLRPKETLTATVKLRAKRPGQKVIIASFDGKELQGISGAATIKVKGTEVIED